MRILLLIIFSLVNYCMFSQGFEMYNDYVTPSSDDETPASTKTSINGNSFTPRGEFKVLFIFVNFDNPNETNPNNNTNWPANQDVPNWYLDKSFIHNDLSDFDNSSLTNPFNLSNYFYQMSKHLPENDRFKIYANHVSVKISIDTNDKSWEGLTVKAYDAIIAKYPNINSILEGYDSRDNSPNYSFDNRNTIVDSIVDYAIIFFRYDFGWTGALSPLPGMEDWYCSGGAYAAIKYKNFGDFKIRQGYTQPPGMSSFGKVFTHEMAHNIFNAPHYGSCNGVMGKYFRSNNVGHNAYSME